MPHQKYLFALLILTLTAVGCISRDENSQVNDVQEPTVAHTPQPSATLPPTTKAPPSATPTQIEPSPTPTEDPTSPKTRAFGEGTVTVAGSEYSFEIYLCGWKLRPDEFSHEIYFVGEPEDRSGSHINDFVVEGTREQADGSHIFFNLEISDFGDFDLRVFQIDEANPSNNWELDSALSIPNNYLNFEGLKVSTVEGIYLSPPDNSLELFPVSLSLVCSDYGGSMSQRNELFSQVLDLPSPPEPSSEFLIDNQPARVTNISRCNIVSPSQGELQIDLESEGVQRLLNISLDVDYQSIILSGGPDYSEIWSTSSNNHGLFEHYYYQNRLQTQGPISVRDVTSEGTHTVQVDITCP